MLLQAGSLVLILLYTSYIIFYSYRRKELISKKMGAFTALAAAFMSSASAAIVAVMSFGDYLIVAVGVALLYAIAAGYVAGKSYSPMTAINGAITGLLGAGIGSLLGILLFGADRTVLIVDTVFIVVMFLFQKTMEWQSRQPGIQAQSKPAKKNKQKLVVQKASYISTVILSVICFIFGFGVLIGKNHIHIGQIGKPQSQMAAIDEKNDMQVATIQLSHAGISPPNTDFKAKQMMKVIVKVEPNAETGLKLISDVLGIKADLKNGDNMFLMNNPQPGTYAYTVEPGGYKGTFTVK
ncbi:hypothetical protein [Paenibacillus aestuarii]|uniref:EfeO-type cupredoxin-like domain-containing protein n=1 Tax=Paenibacillus aestuarii TaxID=516965 RepID=A0ABW0K4G0_9BACL|nr:hypothetical protein [Paenibacillus aestuarii]